MSNGGSGVDKALRAVGAVGAVRAEGVWAHTAVGAVWVVRAVGAEGVWVHKTRTKGRRL